jgi:hypothetical protein
LLPKPNLKEITSFVVWGGGEFGRISLIVLGGSVAEF